MPVERAFFEAMVEELLHQRLGVRERDQALAEVAGREDSILVAQPARRAAVVGNRHDRGEIGRVGLQAAEQRAESGAAPDRDDARPASAKAECVDDLDNASRVRPGKERSEHRLRELQVAEGKQANTQHSEDRRARPVRPELECDVVELVRQCCRLIELFQGLRGTKDQHQLRHHEQEEPAFDLQPGREPAKPTRG